MLPDLFFWPMYFLNIDVCFLILFNPSDLGPSAVAFGHNAIATTMPPSPLAIAPSPLAAAFVHGHSLGLRPQPPDMAFAVAATRVCIYVYEIVCGRGVDRYRRCRPLRIHIMVSVQPPVAQDHSNLCLCIQTPWLQLHRTSLQLWMLLNPQLPTIAIQTPNHWITLSIHGGGVHRFKSNEYMEAVSTAIH